MKKRKGSWMVESKRKQKDIHTNTSLRKALIKEVRKLIKPSNNNQ